MIVIKSRWSALNSKYEHIRSIDVEDDFVPTPDRGTFLNGEDISPNGYKGDWKYEVDGKAMYSYSPSMYD